MFKDKGWWQEKMFLFLFLLISGFLLTPNGTVRGAYCGFGFKRFCSADALPGSDMKPGETRHLQEGWKIERLN